MPPGIEDMLIRLIDGCARAQGRDVGRSRYALNVRPNKSTNARALAVAPRRKQAPFRQDRTHGARIFSELESYQLIVIATLHPVIHVLPSSPQRKTWMMRPTSASIRAVGRVPVLRYFSSPAPFPGGAATSARFS